MIQTRSSKDKSTTTRRNSVNTQKKSVSKRRSSSISSKKEEIPSTSLIQNILKWDNRVTKIIAICSDKDGNFSRFRIVMKFLELSCHGAPWIIANIAGILISHDLERQEILLNFFLALVLDLMIVGSIKALIRRDRPEHNQDDIIATISIDKKYSFPSGHTTRAALIAAFATSNIRLQNPILGVVWSWAIAVSSSRVILGRHYVLDVICGFGIGILENLIAKWFWIPKDTCMLLLKPIHEDLHL